MTTEELNTIVAAVVAELEKSGVDFDYKAEQAEDTDLVFVIRGTAPNYQGLTVTWKGLLDIITAQATQAKTDAETAKNAADTILSQVTTMKNNVTTMESNVSTMKTSVETTKSQVESMKNAVETTKGQVETMKTSIETTKEEVETMKTSVETSKSQVETMKTSIETTKGEVETLKSESETAKETATQKAAETTQAKGDVESMKASIEKTVADFNTLADQKKSEVESVYQSDLNELKGDLTNSKKAIAELDDKKITKFYASNNGNTNLPDSDNGKPTDMKIFGKSVQDGTPSPSNPIEIQSVVNPVVRMEGNNLLNPVSLASLPYTLNAIPVTSEGNVTIDGQQYIADYVDIEKKQLIRNVGEVDLGTLEFIRDGITYRNQLSNFKRADKTKPVLALCEKYYPVSYNDSWNITGMMAQDSSDRIIFVNSKISSTSEFKQSVSGTKLLYALATPTITDLTDEEVQAFKELATYYPVTNAFVASSQLDGHAIFNYPLNMANGWNYVMQQIGETRPIIYDTQVKTIENIIDTAILTAMMEA